MLPENTKPPKKNRTPSRCREWERERRIRFNNAINELGQLLNKTENSNENVSLPKIDIIQKAIVSIKKFMLEMLAHQVKLEKNKQNYKDASTQISKSIKTKLKGVKDATIKDSVNIEHENVKADYAGGYKLPKILPRSTVGDKPGPDKTIVVLPVAPYVIPQRPLFFPAAPPAFVVLDSTLQQPNRSTVPIVTRMSNESTRTTMVNIVPITAFSHPLSVTKAKKTKNTDKIPSKTNNDTIVKKPTKIVRKAKITKEKQSQQKKAIVVEVSKETQPNKIGMSISNSISPCTPMSNPDESTAENCAKSKGADVEITNIHKTSKSALSTNREAVKCNSDYNTETQDDSNAHSILSNKKQNVLDHTTAVVKDKVQVNVCCDSARTKDEIHEIKDKNDKMSTILDTSLCENTVDTGNARLELAEELLASSPTAAFLMSFPLVSGNRAESPTEEAQHVTNAASNKGTEESRENCEGTPQTSTYLIKPTQEETKLNKTVSKTHIESNSHKEILNPKINDNISMSKHTEFKNPALSSTSTENPFLNLPIPPILPTSCSLPDPIFTLDFDCNLNKTTHPSQTSHVSNNNFLYKSETFTAGKGSIYSTSSISAGHDFNTFSSLYPCAMEKYTSKNKTNYTTVEDNIMKAHTSRLTYDIDLGWSHKSFDFVNCTTTSNTFSKDNTYTTTSAPFSSTYNPFNPEFHVPLISSSNKKDNVAKATSYVDTVTNLYSQPSTLWTDEIPFYGSNNINTSKAFVNKQQYYQPSEHMPMPINPKNSVKTFGSKIHVEQTNDNKNSNEQMVQHVPEKYSKKIPSKMPINWMTSETKSLQNNGYNVLNIETKNTSNSRNLYGSLGQQSSKKQEQCDTNYFPLPIHNFSTPIPQEDFQMWPSARPLATAEISIDPPPINLPTLVGDLALGPHEKKRNIDISNRAVGPHLDTPNCNNFFSVTQLMNRSSENMGSRYQSNNIDMTNKINTKQSSGQYPSDKPTVPLLDTHFMQSGYSLNDSKLPNSFNSVPQYPNVKTKSIKPPSDKNTKGQKNNNYSAEALLRGGTCTQKMVDSSMPSKFIMTQQKYHDFNTGQETPVAQVSHFPPILDYPENGYSSQQFTGTSLYSSTTNTMSTSFYSNFIPGGTNLMSTNYNASNFSGDFIDYNQNPECNYSSHKYEEFKPRNSTISNQEKLPSTNYKASRRENITKHKLECTKKESNKKYPSKRPKISHETEDWVDGSNLFWQNRVQSKKQGGGIADELTFPNFVSNQVPSQYQPEFFNSHIMASNVQGVTPNMDRSITSFPPSSRANFNLSTIFPEITMTRRTLVGGGGHSVQQCPRLATCSRHRSLKTPTPTTVALLHPPRS
ncbi:hypothetical protein EVAR_7117_1 [Eumeta japonica]|uniref:BHLH domain-containing protein n=1 Tax=Eumeta variegata TaxID=151549 RepID=A0A4C1U7L4_EUMVA|nr:hypothetical protein EVAR_7117_1 [Eumeta japonica]